MSLIYEASIQFSLPPPVVPMGKVALHFLSKISRTIWLGAAREPPLSAPLPFSEQSELDSLLLPSPPLCWTCGRGSGSGLIGNAGPAVSLCQLVTSQSSWLSSLTHNAEEGIGVWKHCWRTPGPTNTPALHPSLHPVPLCSQRNAGAPAWDRTPESPKPAQINKSLP